MLARSITASRSHDWLHTHSLMLARRNSTSGGRILSGLYWPCERQTARWTLRVGWGAFTPAQSLVYRPAPAPPPFSMSGARGTSFTGTSRGRSFIGAALRAVSIADCTCWGLNMPSRSWR